MICLEEFGDELEQDETPGMEIFNKEDFEAMIKDVPQYGLETFPYKGNVVARVCAPVTSREQATKDRKSTFTLYTGKFIVEKNNGDEIYLETDQFSFSAQRVLKSTEVGDRVILMIGASGDYFKIINMVRLDVTTNPF